MGVKQQIKDFFARVENQYKEKQAQMDKDLPVLIRNAVREILQEEIDVAVKRAMEKH